MKPALLLLSLLAAQPDAVADGAKPPGSGLPANCEVVMSPGMRITATTPAGTIAITAVDDLTRSYRWDADTRTAQLLPRATTTGRVCGSLGIFGDIASLCWREHRGITRGITEEGQQHFKTIDQAMKWMTKRHLTPFVYRDDGLMVAWNKDLQRNRLNVELWQIVIDGKKPKRLPGGQNDKILVESVQVQSLWPAKAVATSDGQAVPSVLLSDCELVMRPGMRITATTPVGTIAVTAVDDLTRSYTWEGATRAVPMEARAMTTGSWFGSLGLFNPGAGEHWREHHGITRCVTEEGQRHFKTVDEALKWIQNERGSLPSVYRDDGLLVGWNKNLGRNQLDVEVWQIFIDGKKPKRLAGSQNDKIIVETVVTETVPLVKAVARNDLKAVSVLLAQGADPNVRNSIEVPVLLMAIRSGSAPIVGALLKSGADPNVRDVDTDWTALLQAIGRADIVRLLLASGANVNLAIRKEDDLLTGVTPLMIAAWEGFEDVVRLLLDQVADVNATMPTGFTALSLAKLFGEEDHRGAIRLLEAAGAKK
jgi:hypothetical protein